MLGKVKVTYEGIGQADSDTIISFRVAPSQAYLCRVLVDEIKQRMKDGKPDLLIMVDKYFQKRSLDQNDFLWGLLEQLSTVLHEKKYDLYKKALMDYGVSAPYICLAAGVPILEQNFRIVQRVNEKVEDGKKMIKCVCYPGSSNYDTKQMTTLLDGVLLDCKDQGIDADIVRRKMII